MFSAVFLAHVAFVTTLIVNMNIPFLLGAGSINYWSLQQTFHQAAWLQEGWDEEVS